MKVINLQYSLSNNLWLVRSLVLSICFYGYTVDAETKLALGTKLLETGGVIEASANNLRIDSSSGTATFTGDVEIKREEFTIRAQEIIVYYLISKDSRQSIKKIRATRDVSFFSNEEVTKADEALYNLTNNIIELSGNVSVTQGLTNFSGNKLVYDLTTGKGSITGRVKAILSTNE